MEVDSFRGLPFMWTQWVAAHFAFHAARIDSVAAGTDALLKDFGENHVMNLKTAVGRRT